MESRGTSSASTGGSSSRHSGKAAHYRVRRGDTLFSIAWRNRLDYRLLARWNGLHPPYVIYPGQLLRLKPFPVTDSSADSPSDTRRREAARKSRAAPPAKTGRQPQAVMRKPIRRKAAPAPKPGSRPAPASGRLHWVWPVRGRVVATWRAGDPLRKGIKIAGRIGEPVRAAEAGKVVYSGSGLIGYGRLIIIKHNENYLSAYGHNRKLLVAQGQQVTRGQKIAEMGKANDGRALLHFEIRRDGKPVNPLRLLPRR